MKQSNFLDTEFSTVDEVAYNPGIIVCELLKKNPHIETLLLGCGKSIVCFGSMCNSNELFRDQHNELALALDVATSIDPHVLASMHNELFWQGIPERRIALVADHTNSSIIFENVNSTTTLQHIYRVLRPGGRFQLTSAAAENEKQLLQNAGFTVSECNTYAYKPL